MAQWVQGVFRPALLVKTCGLLAVHQVLWIDGAMAVSHIPSGLRLATVTTEKQALRLAERLMETANKELVELGENPSMDQKRTVLAVKVEDAKAWVLAQEGK